MVTCAEEQGKECVDAAVSTVGFQFVIPYQRSANETTNRERRNGNVD